MICGATYSNTLLDPGLISVIRREYSDLRDESCKDITSDRAEVPILTIPGVVRRVAQNPRPSAPSSAPESPVPPAPVDPDAVRAELEALDLELARRERAKIAALDVAAKRRLAPRARERLSEFVKQAWAELHPTERLEWNWHLDVICDHVQALAGYLVRARSEHEAGRVWQMPAQNLLINVPPRSLKTEIVGIFFPAWLWLKDPSLKIRYVSGNERVRTNSSRKCRDLIASQWYRESFRVGWAVRGDADAIGLFENTTTGQAYYSTYEQKITGEGTDIIIVDDPLDAKKASSEIERTAVNVEWDNAVENRVNHRPRCVRIGIMQRLHEEDWSAHVLKKGTWRHVCLPTEFENPTPANTNEAPCKCRDCLAGKVSFLGPYDARNANELLHPERLGGPGLTEEKAKGSLYYAGQHQQRPAPLEGGMFKRAWWGRFDPGELPRFRRIAIFVDCSAKKTATGSRTAIGVVAEGWGPDSGKRYVLEAVARPMDIRDIKRVLVGEKRAKDDKAAIDPKSFLGRYPKAVLVIEDKAAGSDVIVELKGVGVNVIAWDPKNSSKESRAFSSTGIVEAGDVLLSKGAGWIDEFLHELGTFPNGTWDDLVDMITMAISYYRGEKALIRTKW